MIATFPQCLFMDIHATHHPLHVHRQVILMKLTLFSQNLSFMSSCRHSITVPLFIFRPIVWSIYWTSSGNVSRKSRMYAQSHIMGNILGTNFIWINTRSWQCLVWHVSLPLMGTAERMWGEIACGIKNNTDTVVIRTFQMELITFFIWKILQELCGINLFYSKFEFSLL